jgi:hypothetical protein
LLNNQQQSIPKYFTDLSLDLPSAPERLQLQPEEEDSGVMRRRADKAFIF